MGYFNDVENKRQIVAETIAYAAYSPKDQFLSVQSSTKNINIGEYVVFSVKSNFPLEYFDWIIVAKNLIINTGRERASDIFSHTTVFSLVVNSDMAPGFHMIVYTKTHEDFLLTDAAFYPVNAINRHKIHFGITQLKDHSQMSVEATLRGDPGSVFMVSTPRSVSLVSSSPSLTSVLFRQFLYGAQGKNLVTKASIMESLYEFEENSRHVHRSVGGGEGRES